MKLTYNFNSTEFDCNDGTIVPKIYKHNLKELSTNLQVLRDYIQAPIHINSAYRTVKHNNAIGGVRNSQHLTCSAADITTKNLTPKQLSRTIEILIKKGKMKQGGVGLYKGFVHYDIRGVKARW